MEAGIDPDRFWAMTLAEIRAQIDGYRRRVQWQAVCVYTTGMLHGASLGVAFGGGKFPMIYEVFPTLFDAGPTAPMQDWHSIKAIIMAHSEDYIKKRGDKSGGHDD